MLNTIWIILKVVALMGVVVMIVGFSAERIIQARVKVMYPAPGKMVDVGDYQLHIHVTGEANNNPTVILEAGLGGFSTAWIRLQDTLSHDTQVVSYDRAGYGWSESSSQPANLTHNARQLWVALDTLNIEPPYIIVGHSLGGLFATVFADLYPDDVMDIVLVDPTPPQLFENLPEDMIGHQSSTIYMMRVLQTLANFGVLRLVNPFESIVGDLPQQERDTALALSASPDYISTYLKENEIFLSLPESMPPIYNLSDKPFIILSTNTAPDGETMPDGMFEIMHRLHEDWAKQSTQGQWHILDGANHFSIIMSEVYAEQVADIVRELLLIPTITS